MKTADAAEGALIFWGNESGREGEEKERERERERETCSAQTTEEKTSDELG